MGLPVACPRLVVGNASSGTDGLDQDNQITAKRKESLSYRGRDSCEDIPARRYNQPTLYTPYSGCRAVFIQKARGGQPHWTPTKWTAPNKVGIEGGEWKLVRWGIALQTDDDQFGHPCGLIPARARV